MDAFTIAVITILVVLTLLYLLCCYTERKELKEKEDKYNVSKYPVTSKMGNKYYVEIKYKHDNFWGDMIYFNMYKREFKKNGKFKDILLNTQEINLKSFSYNYISLVSKYIEKYEEDNRVELENARNEDYSIRKNKKEFEYWDGIIK